jgi:transcriptional regulator with XRE-family HTH domain
VNPVVQPLPPAILELAQRLRLLRQQRWPDRRLTQEALAKALGDEKPLAAATVSSWESSTAPKLPPRDRLLAYARFFASRRSVEAAPRLLPIESLTAEERATYKELEAELLGLRDAARKPSAGEAVAIRRSWHFSDAGPATLVCAQLPKEETGSLADPAHPNYTELLSFADLDALVELHGHIRAENPMMDVFYKEATNVAADDLSGHVILLGGIAWNDITRRLSEMISLPLRQVEDPSVESGEIFVAQIAGKDHKFLPRWGDAGRTALVEDVGLLARVPNPLNSSRTLTICNGIHSRGVLGAVRSLTDARLREFNERYISTNFTNTESFVILMRIQVIEGQAMTPDLNIPGNVLFQWPGQAGS